MTDKYVSDMNPAELRAHMRRLKAMSGWHDPLSDALYAEIQRMDAAAPSASAQQAEPVDGCTEENCRRCRTPEALRTPDMYHAGLSTAAEIADEVCAKSRNHLFRSGAKVVAGAIRSAAPAPGASPEPYNAYQRDWEKVVRWVKFQSETFPELASMSPEGAISWLVVELAARHEKFAEPSVSPAKKTRVEGYHERRGATNPVKQS